MEAEEKVENPVLKMMDEIEKNMPESILDDELVVFYIAGARSAASALEASLGLSGEDAVNKASKVFVGRLARDMVELMLSHVRD